MKNLKTILLLLMCIMVFACGCEQKQQKDDLSIIKSRGKLVVGVKTDAKPFGFYDANHQLQGYDVDLAKAIARAMFGSSNHVRFVPVTTSNRILKLEDEEVDMLIATMSVTTKRRQVLDFSRPYYISGQAMMVRKGSCIKHLQDLDGKHVIVVFGSTGEDNITTHVPSAIIYGYRTYSEAWNAFKSGKGDAFLADDIILKSYVESNGSFKLLPERYSKEPYAVAFRKTEESLRLQSDVNIVIGDLQKTGKLSRMRHKWGLR